MLVWSAFIPSCLAVGKWAFGALRALRATRRRRRAVMLFCVIVRTERAGLVSVLVSQCRNAQ